MNRKQINDKVIDIYLKLFLTNERNPQEICCADNFFGSKIGLLPGDVVAYLYAVEKEFGIQVPCSYLLEGKFNTLENVTDIICEVFRTKE